MLGCCWPWPAALHAFAAAATRTTQCACVLPLQESGREAHGGRRRRCLEASKLDYRRKTKLYIVVVEDFAFDDNGGAEETTSREIRGRRRRQRHDGDGDGFQRTVDQRMCLGKRWRHIHTRNRTAGRRKKKENKKHMETKALFRPCSRTPKNPKLYKILYHIESCSTCMK